MLSRSLLARSSSLRLSAPLTTRVCLRSLSTLRLSQSARCTVPSRVNSRWFSAAPAFRTENQNDTQTSRAPSGSCFIANIPYKITAEELKDAFSGFGKVESVKLLTSDAGLPRGVGFVQFESVADAVSFVEAHAADPIFVLDRQLHVEHAQKTNRVSRSVEPSDTLMVHNFQGDSEVEVRAMFGNYADNILEVRFNRRETDRPSRRAFIQFRDVNMATEAMDAFKNQNEMTQITYARQRQPPANPYTLVSRLSQAREH